MALLGLIRQRRLILLTQTPSALVQALVTPPVGSAVVLMGLRVMRVNEVSVEHCSSHIPHSDTVNNNIVKLI